ncbi:MAG: cytochrome c3 family protein [bacterium]
MRKWFIVTCALVFLVGFVVVGNVYAQFGNKVADTPHNLREAAESPMQLTDWGEICVYCHTPHNNNTAIEAPLWNRSTPSGPYDMYDSPTLDMDIASSPQGVSLACLSCHDNTIALDQIINIPTSKLGTSPSGKTIEYCATNCHVGNGAGGLNFEGTVIDVDLTNDHPISVTYDPSKDPKFHPASGGKVGNLPLYGPNANRVECASCHNPHDNSNRPFLRMSNENSAMCLTCHDI